MPLCGHAQRPYRIAEEGIRCGLCRGYRGGATEKMRGRGRLKREKEALTACGKD